MAKYQASTFQRIPVFPFYPVTLQWWSKEILKLTSLHKFYG